MPRPQPHPRNCSRHRDAPLSDSAPSPHSYTDTCDSAEPARMVQVHLLISRTESNSIYKVPSLHVRSYVHRFGAGGGERGRYYSVSHICVAGEMWSKLLKTAFEKVSCVAFPQFQWSACVRSLQAQRHRGSNGFWCVITFNSTQQEVFVLELKRIPMSLFNNWKLEWTSWCEHSPTLLHTLWFFFFFWWYYFILFLKNLNILDLKTKNCTLRISRTLFFFFGSS